MPKNKTSFQKYSAVTQYRINILSQNVENFNDIETVESEGSVKDVN